MKIILIAVLFGMFSGCTTSSLPFSDKDEAWLLNRNNLIGGNTLFYCKANRSEKGATPQCFEAEMSALK